MTADLTLDEFLAFVRAAGLGVVATATPDGRPEAALLGLAGSATGELVLDTFAGSRKLANLTRNDRVAVVIGWDGDVTLQVEGSARVVSGPERAGYEAVYRQRFPGSRVSDPAFEVVVVTPDWIRRYDAAAGATTYRTADWLS